MSLTTDWNDQRAFLAVLDHGSLSAAARALGVTQPTIRARLEALERELGTVLFTRSVRGLLPTQQARALGSSARAMAHASEAFVRAASACPGKIGGVVRLSVSEVVGIEVVPPMLSLLHERHPALVIELVLSNASANLLEQEVDLAVRMAAPQQEALVAKKAAAIPVGLFAGRGYLARRGEPTTLSDLVDHDLIGSDRTPADLALARSLFGSLAQTRFVIKTDSHPAQLAAARADLGIAVVQRPIGLADPRLQAVLPGLTIDTLDTWIVTHENLRELPRVAAVFDHLAEQFAQFAKC